MRAAKFFAEFCESEAFFMSSLLFSIYFLSWFARHCLLDIWIIVFPVLIHSFCYLSLSQAGTLPMKPNISLTALTTQDNGPGFFWSRWRLNCCA